MPTELLTEHSGKCAKWHPATRYVFAGSLLRARWSIQQIYVRLLIARDRASRQCIEISMSSISDAVFLTF